MKEGEASSLVPSDGSIVTPDKSFLYRGRDHVQAGATREVSEIMPCFFGRATSMSKPPLV